MPSDNSRPNPARRQRLYALLLCLGACVLLARTIAMTLDGALSVLVLWVSTLLVLEAGVDVTTALRSVRWWRTASARDASFALKAGAVATLLHAGRVLVFVLGRTGP